MPTTKAQICISQPDFLKSCPMPDEKSNRRCRNIFLCTRQAYSDKQALRKSSDLCDQLNEGFKTMVPNLRDANVRKLLTWRLCDKHQAVLKTAVQTELRDMEERMAIFTPVTSLTNAVAPKSYLYSQGKVAVPQPVYSHVRGYKVVQKTPCQHSSAYQIPPAFVAHSRTSRAYNSSETARAQHSMPRTLVVSPDKPLYGLLESIAIATTLRPETPHSDAQQQPSPPTPASSPPPGFKVRSPSPARLQSQNNPNQDPAITRARNNVSKAGPQAQSERELGTHDQFLADFEALVLETKRLAARNAELEAQLRASKLGRKRLELQLWIERSRKL